MIAPEVFQPELLLLLLAAFVAGGIDAVVGLILIPALFAAYPREAPAALFGTNKCASVFGTANADWRYARQVNMPWRTILPSALAYFVPNGFGLPVLTLAMAVANVGGSVAGSILALKHGSRFIRRVFLAASGMLIAKFAWDTFSLL